MARRPLALSLLALSLLAVGCNRPSATGHTVFVPSHVASTMVHPQTRRVEVSGGASFNHVSTDWAHEDGDDALQVAHTVFHGEVRVRMAEQVRFGIQAIYSHTALSDVSGVEVGDLGPKSLFGLGPQVGGSFRGERWHVGIGGALTLMTLPWGVWYVRFREPPTRLLDEGRLIVPKFSASLAATWLATERFELFVGGAAETAIGNDGFDREEDRRARSLDVRGNFVPFVGATFRSPASGFFLRLQYQYVVAEKSVRNGGGSLTLGVELDPSDGA